LNMLRSRGARLQSGLAETLPDPIVTHDPEYRAETADSVGLALLVVLDALTPPERIAFVLHDMFGLPFSEIAEIVGHSVESTRQLASRARRRVRGAAPIPDSDLRRQREVVDAFFAAAHDGDFERLVGLLHPDVVLRTDRRGLTTVTGAANVAAQAERFSAPSLVPRAVLVNGAAGVIVQSGERPLALMAFTVVDGRIAEIDVIADQVRLQTFSLPSFDP
ncbi:MAG: RNA polymerase subunit sigma-70, partial [Actinomycetota bacterium]|nr:RNA polymerase subunit sigma-70 [Actinomycetota bacterium]